MAQVRRLRMIAGPNGSGKSELFKNLALERSPSGVFHGGPFVNADELEEQWRTARAIDLAPFPITSFTEELRMLRHNRAAGASPARSRMNG